MVASVGGETASMGTRLEEHVPECNGIVAPDMLSGAFSVTTTVGTIVENLADLVGGKIVVLAVAAEGDVFGRCNQAVRGCGDAAVPECAGHVLLP